MERVRIDRKYLLAVGFEVAFLGLALAAAVLGGAMH